MGSHKTRTKCCCACCGAPSEHEIGTCPVTVQYGDEEQTCVVYQAEFPPQANCMSVIEALIMTNNVREEDAGSHKVGSHRRAYGGARSHTLEQLAEFGKVWSVYDRPMDQAVTWADVKSDIVVREVAAPATSASWETYEAALILTEWSAALFLPHLRVR